MGVDRSSLSKRLVTGATVDDTAAFPVRITLAGRVLFLPTRTPRTTATRDVVCQPTRVHALGVCRQRFAVFPSQMLQPDGSGDDDNANVIENRPKARVGSPGFQGISLATLSTGVGVWLWF